MPEATGKTIAELKGRVTSLNEGIRRLVGRVEARAISNKEARAEYQRLVRELAEAERQVAECQGKPRTD